jgi:hypothetical protein
VILEARHALADGQPRLLRVCPPGAAASADEELVAWRHAREPPPASLPETTDPVCGMTWFRCHGCRGRFLRDPDGVLAQTT